MKTAQISVQIININCPHCESGQETQLGSYDWDVGELSTYGEIMECQECKKEFKKPVIVIID